MFHILFVLSQDVTKIQMDLDYTECIFLGISDAFPKAKIHTKGLSMDEMPTPCIAAIGMKSACIKNERIEFTSCRGEQVSLKLLCREHLQLSASTIELQLRSSSDNLQDVALVKFAETQHSLRHPTYSAVCVGLLLSKWDNNYHCLVYSWRDEKGGDMEVFVVCRRLSVCQ